MSFKRRVLSALGKDHLLEIGRGLELDVTTRMGVEELRDALAKSKRAKLDPIVQESLSRDTLKEICGAVGLEDTGKGKAAHVERIGVLLRDDTAWLTEKSLAELFRVVQAINKHLAKSSSPARALAKAGFSRRRAVLRDC